MQKKHSNSISFVFLKTLIAILTFVFMFPVIAHAASPSPTVFPTTAPEEVATIATIDSAPKILQVGATDEVIINVQLRLIDLNYFSFKHTGTFGSMTRAAVIDFQSKNELLADGSIGQETLTRIFQNDAVRKPEISMPSIGIFTRTSPTVFGELEDWSNIKTSFAMDQSVKITDLNTGKTFNVTRKGGANHADVIPSNASDKIIFLECFGGSTNWSKRPVLVLIDGKQIAGSLSGDLRTTTALYFKSSSSDSANLIDQEHRKSVLRAAGSLPW